MAKRREQLLALLDKMQAMDDDDDVPDSMSHPRDVGDAIECSLREGRSANECDKLFLTKSSVHNAAQ